MGRNAHHHVQAGWVLNHQFLCMREKTAANAPGTERPSIWYLGYDPISERYVLHLNATCCISWISSGLGLPRHSATELATETASGSHLNTPTVRSITPMSGIPTKTAGNDS